MSGFYISALSDNQSVWELMWKKKERERKCCDLTLFDCTTRLSLLVHNNLCVSSRKYQEPNQPLSTQDEDNLLKCHPGVHQWSRVGATIMLRMLKQQCRASHNLIPPGLIIIKYTSECDNFEILNDFGQHLDKTILILKLFLSD